MVTLTLKGIKREKLLAAIEQEPEGQGKEVRVENEEMQRVKYQGATITHYKKGGTLCAQGQEMDVVKIKAQLTEEEDEAENEEETEEKETRRKEREKQKHKEQNKKLTDKKAEGRSVVKRLEEMKYGINTTMGRYIKEVKEVLENNDKEQKNSEEIDQKEDTDRDKGQEEKATDTRKREREDEELMSENISFDLNAM